MFFKVIFRQIDLFKNGTDTMVAGFVLAMMLSHVRHGWLGGTIVAFREFLPIFVGYYLSAHAINSEKQLKFILFVIVSCTSFLAIEAMNEVQNGVSYFGIEPMNYLGEIRVMWLGPFSDPNDLGMLFVLVVPFLVNNLFEKKRRIITFGLILLNIYGIILTNSRGAMLSLMASIACYLVLRYRSLRGLWLGLAIALIIVLFGPSRMSQMSASEDSAHGRLDAWYAGYLMFTSYPIFGVGKGQFIEYHNLTAHNSFVLVTSELGFFGAFFFAGVFYFTLMKCYRFFAKGEMNNDAYKIYCACSSSLIGIMSAMFFLSRSYMLLPYLMVGFSQSIIRIYQTDLTCPVEGDNYKAMSFNHIKNIFLITLSGIVLINLLVKVAL